MNVNPQYNKNNDDIEIMNTMLNPIFSKIINDTIGLRDKVNNIKSKRQEESTDDDRSTEE